MSHILFQITNLVCLTAVILIIIGLGLLVAGRFGGLFSGFGEKVFFSAGFGFAIAGYSVFILGAFQLLNPSALSLLIVLLAILSLAGWYRSWPLPGLKTLSIKPDSAIEWAAAVLTAAGLFACLLLTLAPETGKDALIYHLAVPKLFLKHEGFYFIPGNIFSNYPLLNEMLFTAGLFLRGEIVAKGMHFIALLFVMLGIRRFSRLKTIDSSYPWLSMLIFLSIPSVFLTAPMAYIDLFFTYYAIGALLAYLQWVNQNERAWLVLCGLFSGLALASKYNGLFLPFLGCLGILWVSHHKREHGREALYNLLLYAAVTVAAGLPFYVKNAILSGNPLYPFFYSVFGGPGWDPRQAQLYDQFVWRLGMGREWIDYLLLPWNLSFRAAMDSLNFDGLIGPVFILTLPFLFAAGNIPANIRIILIYTASLFVFWTFSAQQVRYLFPIFPLFSVLTGWILARARMRNLLFIPLIVLTAGSIVYNGFSIAKYLHHTRPLGAAIGFEDRESYLGRRIPSYAMFSYINQALPGEAKIFFVYMKNWGFLCDREYYSDSMFESYTLQKILSQSSSPEDVHRTFKSRGFSHLLCDMDYIFGGRSLLSMQEKEMFAGFVSGYCSAARQDKSYCLFRIN